MGVGEYGVAGLLGEAVPALAPGGLMVAGGTATTGIDGGGDFTVGSLDLASSTFGTGLGDGDGVGV